MHWKWAMRTHSLTGSPMDLPTQVTTGLMTG